MTTIIIFFIIVILLAVFLVPHLKNSNSENKEKDLPYVKKESLMTEAEYNFFKVLEEAVKDKYYIVPQVQLSNLVEVEKDKKWEYSLRNKIDRKSVDFVLFNKENFTPHLVIELDDSSHLREDRKIRDNFVDSVLNKVGIKIVHIKTSHIYDSNELFKLLKI